MKSTQVFVHEAPAAFPPLYVIIKLTCTANIEICPAHAIKYHTYTALTVRIHIVKKRRTHSQTEAQSTAHSIACSNKHMYLREHAIFFATFLKIIFYKHPPLTALV